MVKWKSLLDILDIFILFVLVLVSVPSLTKADDAPPCPTPGTATCRIDCSADIYDFLCVETGNYSTIRTDLDALSNVGHQINVYFWNLDTPNFQIDSNIFGDTLEQILTISVTDASTISLFPMLRGAKSLKSLIIIDAPGILELPIELLPPGMELLKLYNTGISRLESDVDEKYNVSKVRSIIFQGTSFTYIAGNFFKPFSGLKSLSFIRNRFSMAVVDEQLFSTTDDPSSALDQFIFRENTFTDMSDDLCREFVGKMLRSLQLNSFATVDLSNNNLHVDSSTLESIKLLQNVERLFMQGNPFDNSMTITDLFANFTNLRELDLSYTNLPVSPGTFSGLPNLDVLRLAGNYFADMTAVDMFAFTTSTMLRVLDLSYNSLTVMPEGDLIFIAPFIQELDLTGNGLRPPELLEPTTDSSTDATPSDKSTFGPYPELRYLGLGNNNWTDFYGGKLLASLQKLQTLDLSCNLFHRSGIHSGFFAGLPESLDTINMTFCVFETDEAPDIAPDAFSTMPPIRTLILANGNLKNWIFERLRQMPNESLWALENVMLQENSIRFLHADKFKGMPNLKVLNLRGNTLQSMGFKSFRDLASLKTLIISSNQLVSVDTDDLVGLINLEQLDLHDNKIAHIDSGAFDSLTSLTTLFLGKNVITGISGLFTTGAKNLKHLGLQKNPIACINWVDLTMLRSVKWIYLHNLTIPIFIDDQTSKTPLKDRIYAIPVNSGDDLDCDRAYDFPVLHASEITNEDDLWKTDFIRLPLDNPWDLAPRAFLAHFAKCYSRMDRNVTNITSNLFCEMKDSKTAGTISVSSSFFLILILLFFGYIWDAYLIINL